MRKSVLFSTLFFLVVVLVWGFRASAGPAARNGEGAVAGRPGASANGDLNGDGGRDISDAVYLLSWLFQGGPEPVAIAGGLGPEVESLRIFDPTGATSNLWFGPTDDCSLGIDARFPGIVERDPIGFRLLGRDNQGCRLIFGPTMDCTVEVQPNGPPGLLLRDPRGIRLLGSSGQDGVTRLIFGPTDDCSLSIDPALPGLTESDPVGFRLLGRDSQGCRLIFGPTMDCTVEVDPQGPPGLLLRDPRGIRILSPPVAGGPGAPRLIFGPTDDCSLGIEPELTGLIERDPVGLRLMGAVDAEGRQLGCRLIFGPTMDCTVEVAGLGPDGLPAGPEGLLLRDPRGIRILNPIRESPTRLIFGGPTDDCSIAISGLDAAGAPAGPAGLLLRDPRGIRILSPIRESPSRLIFGGPDDNCSIFVDPANPDRQGLRFSDPRGFFFEGGPIFANEFVQASSRRFKEDVQPIESAMDIVKRLEGVRFRWDEAHGGESSVGFIAEQVAEVVPELVSFDADGESAQGVNYGPIVAIAVEGLKEQDQRIETLTTENQALRGEVDQLKASLEALQRQVEALVKATSVTK